MSKKDEALKLALEALEFDGFMPEDATHRHYTTKAITAIREALAEQPAQQEPVAYASDVEFDDETEIIPAEQKGKLGTAGLRIPLYIDPPASKPLTDEQWYKVHRAAWEAFFGCALDSVHGQIQCAAHAAMRATEAAHGIKEKNSE